MKLPRRKFLQLAAGAAALPAFTRMAWALDYPTRPVQIVVAWAAGINLHNPCRSALANNLSSITGRAPAAQSAPRWSHAPLPMATRFWP
jgi:hypothetical protein